MRALSVSIHDVAPATLGACSRIADAINDIDARIPVTLLVVPHYHGDTCLPRDFVAWMETRLARGDELALHGFTHRDESRPPRALKARAQRRLYTASEGEFAALTREQARERLARGRQWFSDRGWPLAGFVAPAWLMSEGTWQALSEFDFAYTTTLSRFHLLERHRAIRAPSIVYSTRAGWRRGLSRLWNAALDRAARDMPLVRIGFHPADADFPEIMSHALALTRGAARTRVALTKARFAREYGAAA